MSFITNFLCRAFSRELPTTGPRLAPTRAAPPAAAEVAASAIREGLASSEPKPIQAHLAPSESASVTLTTISFLNPLRTREEIERQKAEVSTQLEEFVSPHEMNDYLIRNIAKVPTNPVEESLKEYFLAIKADLDRLEVFDDRIAEAIDDDLVMHAIIAKHHVDPAKKYQHLKAAFLEDGRLPLATELVLMRLGFKRDEIKLIDNLLHPIHRGSVEEKVEFLETIFKGIPIARSELSAIFDRFDLELKHHPKKAKDLTFLRKTPTSELLDLRWHHPRDLDVIKGVETIPTLDELYAMIAEKLLNPKSKDDLAMLDELALAFGVRSDDLDLKSFSEDELIECCKFFMFNFSQAEGPRLLIGETPVAFDEASFRASERPENSRLKRRLPTLSDDGRLVILPKEGIARVLGSEKRGDRDRYVATIETSFRPIEISEGDFKNLCQEIAKKLIEKMAK